MDNGRLYNHKRMGLVADIFDEESFKELPGKQAIGHVRYSTTGSSQLRNAQPIAVEYAQGNMAIAHNGNLVNSRRIRDELGGPRLHFRFHGGFGSHRPSDRPFQAREPWWKP